MEIKKNYFCKYKILFTLILFCTAGFAYAQNDLIDSLTRQFDRFRINNHQEKVYVHIDQEFYLTGENLWFKIYYVDGALHRPLNLSKVAYLEILDKDNHAVLQTKVALKDGEGNGSLFLPASINTGNYHVRAYTHWMKNFSPDYFFQKPITIINSFRKPEIEKTIPIKQFTAQFFPEGGNLVFGLKSKVAFQILDANGKGLNFNGFIMDDANDTIATIKPLKHGIGSFIFRPLTNNRYRAVVIDTTGHSHTFNLPTPLDQGYVMEVKDSSSDWAVVNVTSAFKTEPSIPIVYFLVHSRQIISAVGMRYIKSGRGSFAIDKTKLGEGISHITVFDDNLRPVCERLFYKPSERKLKIAVDASQREYGIRRKVVLDITVRNQTDSIEHASLSVAVVKTDSLQPGLTGNIFNYLWFSSDLNGVVESPEYYANNDDPEVVRATDNVMLTHGWRRFEWQNILQGKKSEPTFLPEYRGHLIHGTVLDVNREKTGGVLTYLSIPGKNVQLYTARSNANGEVRYEMKDFWGPKKIIAQTNTEHDSTKQIKIHSPYADVFSQHKLLPPELLPQAAKNLLSRSIAMQVQDIFYADSSARFKISKIDSTAIYGKADEAYLLDDFTRFSVMEEVMREYVPGVMVRKRKGHFHFMVLDIVRKGVFQDDPLILLDGIPIFDVDKIMAFDPLKVKKLEVLTRKYFFGPLIFPGIVSYTTYNGDLAGFQLDPNVVSVDYEGLQRQRIFYSPQYENQKQRESRMPDRRNLLFWAPQVSLNRDGTQQLEFYTSDLTGDYTIVIEGLTKNGSSGSATSSFTVKQFNN